MTIGQASSNSLVGTQVFSTQSSGNTGINPAQIRPVDLSGEENRQEDADSLNLAPPVQTYNSLGRLASEGGAAVGRQFSASA